MTPMPFELSRYLSWYLSNTNHDVDTLTGDLLSVAFNAWAMEDGTFSLGVSWYNEDTQERGEHLYRVTMTESQ